MNASPRRTLSDLKGSERFNRSTVRESYELTRLRFELGEAVRLRRDELGWSQAELGKRADMPQPDIARFGHGVTQPTPAVPERLTEAL